MRLFWQERRAGQRLILDTDDEGEVEVGAVRQTPRGYDALAKTNTYDPGRAQKGFATIEEAKVFVEEFHPWDLFGGDPNMEVEPEVRRLPTEPASPGATSMPPEVSAQATELPSPGATSMPPEDSAQATEPAPSDATSMPPEDSAQATEPASPGATSMTPGDSAQATEPASPGATSMPPKDFAQAREDSAQNATEEKQPQKRGWRFWQRP